MDYDTYHAGYGYGASGFADSSQPTAFINEPSAFISGPDQATGQSQHAVAQGGPPLPNWQAAEDIERDVSALNAKINTLIEKFGFDPEKLTQYSSPSDSTSPSVTHAQPVAQAIASPWSANAQLPTRPPLSTSSIGTTVGIRKPEINLVVEKHCPSRAAYLPTVLIVLKSPIQLRISSQETWSVGAKK